MNPNQPQASSSKSHYFPFSPSPTPSHPSTEHGEPQYTFSHHSSHTDPTYPAHPLEDNLSQLPTQSKPNLREPPNPDLIPHTRPTLSQFRISEGPAIRSAKLSALWDSLPTLPTVGEGPTDAQRMNLPDQDTMTALSPERVERLRRLYEEELVRRCKENRPAARLWGGPDYQPEVKAGEGEAEGKGIRYADFRRFLWDQESQLWDIFQDLDKNGDGRLDATEIRAALSRSGIDITPATVNDLVRFLANGSKMSIAGRQTPSSSTSTATTTSTHTNTKQTPQAMSNVRVDENGKTGSGSGVVDDMYITFQEFRDFLIMLPRKATPFEIYKFYQVRKRSDGRGAARVDKEGDISISFPKRASPPPVLERDDEEDGDQYADTLEQESAPEERNEAWRFLLAGGLAGAVSRSVTAPFDRLKIYLITTEHTYIDRAATSSGLSHPLKTGAGAVKNLWAAMTRIYVDGGGVRAFWVGNGLNIIKILPESAIKFLSYEQTKKVLARYWDRVKDPSELSSSSRFLAGGVGGITSQFVIYGLETLKTRIQSETGPSGVAKIARTMWREGGLRTYYRGLTLGLIGVFPYSAIDMGTYETLKRAYCKSTGKDEPEVLATLGFGAMSGSIGAASVYPVNLLRTRLQASGSSGHPQQYTGFRDVLNQTLAREGWRGLYKGLLPSIMKVGPAVGVSWIVYEDAKRRLGV